MALSDPLDVDTLDSLRYILKCNVEGVVAPAEEIEIALRHYYATPSATVESMLNQITEGTVAVPIDGIKDLTMEGEATEADAPIIKLVSLIILEAFRNRASDIHLEPLEKKFRVRYRIDGVLHEVDSPPKRLQSAIVSRVKIMANMKIAEKRLPQDGRIQINVMGRDLDLRVSTIPSSHGESIVMRILDKQSLAARPAAARLFRGRPADLRAADQPVGRDPPRHRSHRIRQDDDAVRLPELHQPAGPQDHHGRGPGRVPAFRHQPGPRARGHRAHLRGRAAVDPAPGAEHHHDRRNPRLRDGGNRRQRVADRPPRVQHAAHE